MRLVSYNILVGGRGRLDAIASVLQNLEPDVVILEEVYNPQSARTLARELDMPNWCARERHSMAVLSRLPVHQCRWHATPVSRRRVLEVGLPGLTLFGVHLQPYFFRGSEAQRLREVRALLAMLSHYRELPHLVVGDFNSIAPGEAVNLRRMPLWVGALLFLTGGQFDSPSLQALLDAGYIDVLRALHPDENLASFPAVTPQIRLDYLFAPPTMIEQVRECRIVRNGRVPRASDHCPLLAVVDV